MATLTDKSGNPANTLSTHYGRLMSIDCPNTLKSEALALVVGQPGISKANSAKFKATVNKETRLDRLQSYLTNFMLKADGHGVI